jgi:hypothetical protein
VSKLVAGTAVFSGTATFQSGSSGPYVSIGSGGVTAYHSGTNYLTMNSSGLTVYASGTSGFTATSISMGGGYSGGGSFGATPGGGAFIQWAGSGASSVIASSGSVAVAGTAFTWGGNTVATQNYVTGLGYQTASQVATAITGYGYQTAAQVAATTTLSAATLAISNPPNFVTGGVAGGTGTASITNGPWAGSVPVGFWVKGYVGGVKCIWPAFAYAW